MVYILLARNDRDELVLLDGKKTRESLRLEVVSTKFYCPQCHGEVRMKIGSVKIPHFAHRSKTICESFSEPESEVHLLAKQQLYQWLKNTHQEIQIEKTYREFSQRADLSVVDDGYEYAIEFQRSPLIQEDWVTRTNGYTNHNVIPFWLLSTDCLSAPALNQITLSTFHQLFIRYSKALHQFFLLTYDVPSQSFVIFEHLIPLTKNKFFCVKSAYDLSLIKFPQFPLKEAKLDRHVLNAFQSYCARWCEDRLRYGKGQRDPLLRDFYKEKQTIQLLPPWVGLPLRNGIYIKNSTIEWQAYLFLLLRKSYEKSLSVTLGQAIYTTKLCLNQKKIEFRRMHTSQGQDVVRLVVQEYFDLLTKLTILNYEDGHYMLTKNNPYTFVNHIALKKELGTRFWKEASPIIEEHFSSISVKVLQG